MMRVVYCFCVVALLTACASTGKQETASAALEGTVAWLNFASEPINQQATAGASDQVHYQVIVLDDPATGAFSLSFPDGPEVDRRGDASSWRRLNQAQLRIFEEYIRAGRITVSQAPAITGLDGETVTYSIHKMAMTDGQNDNDPTLVGMELEMTSVSSPNSQLKLTSLVLSRITEYGSRHAAIRSEPGLTPGIYELKFPIAMQPSGFLPDEKKILIRFEPI